MKFSPVANTLKLIGGKWKIMILDNLLSKHMRFCQLKRSLNGITSQMLSKQLKEMEKDKLLIKKILNLAGHYRSAIICSGHYPGHYLVTIRSLSTW